jgi:Ring finger domain
MIIIAVACLTSITVYTTINAVKWFSRNCKDWINMAFPDNTDSMIIAEIMASRGPLTTPQSLMTASRSPRATPNNVKLSRSVIAGSIYQRDANDMDIDCVVCLGQLQEGEKVVKLPLCHHLFHEKCINLWICRNSTCPLCRLQLSE